ncbi:ATP-dependent RNA helicase A [Perkinsus chesapeaki]|uniref:ATP-dependent RNA helicase A n=1 Tax=Perkinsus chesapeaki TaxID=330153 RepID=A0A7J6MZ76_PERCH|nr:ATP-dependent RNA helicase A [Perkinsus chesapeaki]
MTFLSFSLAPQTLLAGISAIQFVSNLVFSRYFLGEPVTFRNVMGTCWLIGGIALVVVSSANSDDSANVNFFFSEYYFSQNHLVFICSIFGVVCFLALAFWFRTGVLPVWKHHSRSERVLVFELSLPRSQTPLTRFFIPTSFVMLSAMLGAQSVVSGKVLSLIIAEAFTESQWKELYKGRTFLVLFLWILAAIVWVIQLNRSLRVFAGAYIIPLTQVCWTSWTMISGGVVFQEFDKMTNWQLPLFIIGTLVLFWGVSLLAPRQKRPPKHHIQQQHQQPAGVLDSSAAYDSAASAAISPTISALSAGAGSMDGPVVDLEGIEVGIEEDAASSSVSTPKSAAGVTVLMSAMSVGALPDVEAIELTGFHHYTAAHSSVGRSPSGSELSGVGEVNRTFTGVFDVDDPPFIRTRNFIKRWQNDRREIKESKAGSSMGGRGDDSNGGGGSSGGHLDAIPEEGAGSSGNGLHQTSGTAADGGGNARQPPVGRFAAYDPWRGRFRDHRLGDTVDKSDGHGLPRSAFSSSSTDPSQLVINQISDQLQELLKHTDVVGIHASTGSGKTTQVPQMLLDYGRRMRTTYRVLVTQPRRVATLSVAMKVRDERQRIKGDEKSVGYMVHNISSLPAHLTTVDCGSILYCTEGTLLARMGQRDGAMFNGMTHLILDEVHERSAELDILLGVMREYLSSGMKGLKVILMSASDSVADILEYLSPGSVARGSLLTVNEQLFDVQEYYLEETVKLVGFEPPAWSDMSSAANVGDRVSNWAPLAATEEDMAEEAQRAGLKNYDDDALVQKALHSPALEASRIPTELIESLLMWIINDWTDKMEAMHAKAGKSHCAVLIFLPGMGSITKMMKYLMKSSPCAATFRQHYFFIPFHRVTAGKHAGQLFRRLDNRVQGQKIKCVLATNVAETSLTIPDLRYVIDCCRQKVKMSRHQLEVWWAGRFNCLQRRGRTGRTCSGICFHLVPEKMFRFGLPDQLEPCIAREPLDSILLQSLCISQGRFMRGLDELLNFYSRLPYDPQPRRVVLTASMLREAGALDRQGLLTNRGKILARLPISPVLGCGLLCARVLFNTGTFEDAVGFWLATTLLLLMERSDMYARTDIDLIDSESGDWGDDSDDGASIATSLSRPQKLTPSEIAAEVHFGVQPQEERRESLLSDHFEQLRFEIEWEQKWLEEGQRSAQAFAGRRRLRHQALSAVWTDRDLLLEWLDGNGLVPKKHFDWLQATKNVVLKDGWAPKDLVFNHIVALEMVLAAAAGSDLCQCDAVGAFKTVDPPYKVGEVGQTVRLRLSESSILHLYPQISPDGLGYEHLQIFTYSGRTDGLWDKYDRCIGRMDCLTPMLPASLVVASTGRLRYSPGVGLYFSDRALMEDCEGLQILWRVREAFGEAMDMVAEQWLDRLDNRRDSMEGRSGFENQSIDRAARMAMAIGGIKSQQFNNSLVIEPWYED